MKYYAGIDLHSSNNYIRFKKVGHYSSCCRCVKSEKTSNKKKKGENNKKNGNKFLSWAYAEFGCGREPNKGLVLNQQA